MKFIGNGAQHAIATAAAAHLCKRHNTTPRKMQDYLPELKQLCIQMTGLGDTNTSNGGVKSISKL